MKWSSGQKFFKKGIDYLKIVLSISGFVPNHATVLRVALISSALFATAFFSYQYYGDAEFAIAYFFITTAVYLMFIYTVLPGDGARLWFLNRFGERGGYLTYEAILGFLFFMQGAGIGYLSSSLPVEIELSVVTQTVLQVIGVVCFIIGFGIKVWATKVVSVDIYYWKDMFLGRRISEFVEKGPYKYVKNPMYGLGHLQVYGTAIWYFSFYGLLFAIINQLAIFSFYFLQEKKFINRVYNPKVVRLTVAKRATLLPDT